MRRDVHEKFVQEVDKPREESAYRGDMFESGVSD